MRGNKRKALPAFLRKLVQKHLGLQTKTLMQMTVVANVIANKNGWPLIGVDAHQCRELAKFYIIKYCEGARIPI